MAAKKKKAASKKIEINIPVTVDPSIFAPDKYMIEDTLTDTVYEEIESKLRAYAAPIAEAVFDELQASGKLDKMIKAGVVARIKSGI